VKDEADRHGSVDTYNHERFIEEAIVSVLQQDFARGAMEMIVVEHGSTDPTPEIVRRFEPQLRLIRQANGGQASPFNAGFSERAGKSWRLAGLAMVVFRHVSSFGGNIDGGDMGNFSRPCD
jgi:glycosyltransferase involved in cell wall biosynthesis